VKNKTSMFIYLFIYLFISSHLRVAKNYIDLKQYVELNPYIMFGFMIQWIREVKKDVKREITPKS
jgi:hypothetical protein